MSDFTKKELKEIQELRELMPNEIPEMLDTDFHLRRWIRSYHHDLPKVVHNLRQLIESRKCLKIDTPNWLDYVWEVDLNKKYVHFFSGSIMEQQCFVNSIDNSVVWTERMNGIDLKKLVKVIKSGDAAIMYFLCHEMLTRHMLKQEERSGKESSIAVIIDMRGAHMTDFMNPFSAQVRWLRTTLMVWQRWFSENVAKLLIVHPPVALSGLWPIAKHLLGHTLQKRIQFLYHHTDLMHYLSPDCVPKDYGGTRIDASGWGVPDTCVNIPTEVVFSHYYVPGSIWTNLPKSSKTSLRKTSKLKIKPGHVETVTELIKHRNSSIAYQFTANRDTEFCVMFTNDREGESINSKDVNNIPEPDCELLYPYVTVDPVTLPEEGLIECSNPGLYSFHFTNNAHSWWNTHVELIIMVIDGGDDQ